MIFNLIIYSFQFHSPIHQEGPFDSLFHFFNLSLISILSHWFIYCKFHVIFYCFAHNGSPYETTWLPQIIKTKSTRTCHHKLALQNFKTIGFFLEIHSSTSASGPLFWRSHLVGGRRGPKGMKGSEAEGSRNYPKRPNSRKRPEWIRADKFEQCRSVPNSGDRSGLGSSLSLAS